MSKKNHIPSTVVDLYTYAFVRKYKKFIGEPIPELPIDGIEIKVLGAGCPSCDRLEQDLMILIEETGVEVPLEHVRDFKEISKYGVMGSPALVINGKVKAVG
ncbi:thioredoxin family protein [Desulfobacula sp.]|uniref:thioredoxin family protein n=1 Tax=Desulfobacula sp. TaxID=2593537 RepID=UPI0026239F3A|nr:thioredoxin family protein [Desulfobacula sp.]